MKNNPQNLGRYVAFLLVLLVLSVAEAQQKTSVPEYRDLKPKADGLECHMFTELTSSATSPTSGTLSTTGRSFECRDASKKLRAIKLVGTQKLDNGKVAVMTKDFGTVYYRNDETCVASKTAKTAEGKPIKECTERDIYSMTDVQIKNLKLFLGLFFTPNIQ